MSFGEFVCVYGEMINAIGVALVFIACVFVDANRWRLAAVLFVLGVGSCSLGEDVRDNVCAREGLEP